MQHTTATDSARVTQSRTQSSKRLQSVMEAVSQESRKATALAFSVQLAEVLSFLKFSWTRTDAESELTATALEGVLGFALSLEVNGQPLVGVLTPHCHLEWSCNAQMCCKT